MQVWWVPFWLKTHTPAFSICSSCLSSFGLDCGVQAAMYPAQSLAMRFQTVTEVREHYSLPGALWQAFTEVCGDPQDDLKLLAVLPPRIASASLERAHLPDSSWLSAIQAFHVGLVYSLARRIVHTRGGGDWDGWTETSPFGDTAQGRDEGTPAPTSTPPTLTSERKLKMT